jgi:hypothetical protein
MQESFEWVDFRELTDEEIKPHSQHPLPLPKPAQVPALITPPSRATLAPQIPGTTPAQARCFHVLVSARGFHNR